MRALASLSTTLLTGCGWLAPWSLVLQAPEIWFFLGHGSSRTCQEALLRRPSRSLTLSPGVCAAQ